MSKSILITGGAASGKSRWAASYFSGCDNVLYLKVGGEIDHDVLHRIEFDNKQRGLEWNIMSTDKMTPAEEIASHKFVIFDSLSSFTRLALRGTSTVEALSENAKKELEKRVIDETEAVLDRVFENNGNIVIITVETGFQTTTEDSFISAYRDILGRVNQRIANSADEVYFSASGIQFKIK